MIKNLKYRFIRFFTAGKIRACCAIVLALATFSAISMFNLSVNTVKVFDGSNTFITRTLSPNTASVLSTMKLKSQSYKVVSTVTADNVTTINIVYTFPVFITNNGYVTKVNVSDCTVEEALFAAGFSVDEHDIIEPSLDTKLTETAYIDYINIDYVSQTLTETVPYSVNTVYSNEYKVGTTTTLTKGANGSRAITYTSKLVNGELHASQITGVQTLSDAVSEVKVIGTKKTSVKTSENTKSISTLKPSSPIELDANGVPVNYKSMRTARATAYTYTGNNCSTGVAPQPGYIAVNPKVIPYGTKMYIKTSDGSYIYGYAVAADTGGFIKNHPTGVDLFMTSESACRSFGVRTVEIYILE